MGVRSTPGYEKMKKLSSFVALQTGVGVGSKVELTVDLFTAVGVLVLANSDPKKMEADMAEVRKMEKEGLFTFDEEVDPVQAEASPDTIVPSGRRRTESYESAAAMNAVAGKQLSNPRVAARSKRQLVVVAAAAFAAGARCGLLASKKMK